MGDQPNSDLARILAETIAGHEIGVRGVLAICACLKRAGVFEDKDTRFVCRAMREGIPAPTSGKWYDAIEQEIARGEAEIETIAPR